MINNSFMYLKSFIYTKSQDLAMNFVGILVFVVVMFLYNISLDAIIYALIIWGFIFVLYLGYSYYKYHLKLKALDQCLNHQVFIGNEMPEAKNQIEESYQDLVIKMNKDNQSLSTSFDQKQTDIEDYYSLWTHQIKTPIAASKLLLNEEISSRTISQMKQELQKIEAYVESALYFARLDSMNQDFNFESVDLDQMIKSMLRKYSTFFIYKKLSLNYEPISKRVITDEKWLMFVLEQLLTNALKYTKEGSITITYNSHSHAIEIQDTGIGIKSEDIDQVFNKGFTGFNGRMDKSSTGIGLYLCDQIIGKLGHSIKIESKLDVGTKVSICLDNNIKLTKV